VVFTNVVKLWLSTSIGIYLVVSVSQIVGYKEQVGEQKIEKAKQVEIEGIEE